MPGGAPALAAGVAWGGGAAGEAALCRGALCFAAVPALLAGAVTAALPRLCAASAAAPGLVPLAVGVLVVGLDAWVVGWWAVLCALCATGRLLDAWVVGWWAVLCALCATGRLLLICALPGPPRCLVCE